MGNQGLPGNGAVSIPMKAATKSSVRVKPIVQKAVL